MADPNLYNRYFHNGNFYTKRGRIFDFQNGNSRWPWLADECGEARAKPCMFHYAKACVLDCTCRLLRFKEDYYYYYYYYQLAVESPPKRHFTLSVCFFIYGIHRDEVT